MKKLLMTTAAFALLTTTAHAAPEEPVNLYTGKYWRTNFMPSNSGGVPMCVTTGVWTFSSGARGQAMLKFSNDMGMFMHISKSSWRFPPGVTAPVSITFDAGRRDGDATTLRSDVGTSNMLQITFKPGAEANFVSDFAASNSMVITFRSGNEPPWSAQMSGSSEAAQAFRRCVKHVSGGSDSATSPLPRNPATSPLPNGQTTSPIPGKPGPTSPVKRAPGDNGSV